MHQKTKMVDDRLPDGRTWLLQYIPLTLLRGVIIIIRILQHSVTASPMFNKNKNKLPVLNVLCMCLNA